MAESGFAAPECDFCKDKLRASATPKLLECHHSFCLDCLDGILNATQMRYKINCPICRHETKIPFGRPKNLQTNFYIGEPPRDMSSCEACGRNIQPNIQCLDCKQGFCDMCASTHLRMASSREHKLTYISEKDGEEENVKIKVKDFCNKHQTDELKMFCKDCREVICIICKLTVHDGHKCTDISTEAANRKQTIISLITSSRKKVSLSNKNITKARKSMSCNNSTLLQKVDDLKRIKEEVVFCINRKFDDKLKMILDELSDYKRSTEEEISKCNADSKICYEAIEKSQKSVEKDSDLEMIRMFDMLSEDLQSVQEIKCANISDAAFTDLFLQCNAWLQQFGAKLFN